ncbi:hypothetical protein BY457_12716 [Marinilabilia salmonicolor]|jgi:hypothetical protein|nr:hypothetical protein BY457_12716 [Marinilabilia salmonicolor]
MSQLVDEGCERRRAWINQEMEKAEIGFSYPASDHAPHCLWTCKLLIVLVPGFRLL